MEQKKPASIIYVNVYPQAFQKDILEFIKMFFPRETIYKTTCETDVSNADYEIRCQAHRDHIDKSDKDDLDQVYSDDVAGGYLFCSQIFKNRLSVLKVEFKKNIDKGTADGIKREIKNGLKSCIYDLLTAYTKKIVKWGILTGIRPTKIVNKMIDEGLTNQGITDELRYVYRLHDEKIQLLLDTTVKQRPFIQNINSNFVSVYIHIPFCTTRCLYCSFPSDMIGRVSDLIDKYINCLGLELSSTMKQLRSSHKKVDSVYIGGGTPTSLSTDMFERLLKLVDKHVVSQNNITEYTVEAGRPDSLNSEKMHIMKAFGVNRLSINPQTMNQETLDVIGRKHTVDQIYESFNMARKLNFRSINMDIIIGLPGEGLAQIEHTMKEIATLKPDNLTVHTLAIKRASDLKESISIVNLARDGLAEEMGSVCNTYVEKMGLLPYYLYRQKYMLDNMENVGYSSPGMESIYNIFIMEESRSIWAFGAGAISKVHYPKDGNLERLANVKNIKEYIGRIEEMIEKKLNMLSK